jgi:hypothetical protein
LVPPPSALPNRDGRGQHGLTEAWQEDNSPKAIVRSWHDNPAHLHEQDCCASRRSLLAWSVGAALWTRTVRDRQINTSTRQRKLQLYRVNRPWLTSTFDELIVYCRTTLLLSKKITSDFLSPSAPLWMRLT